MNEIVENLVEVILTEDDNFLKIKETLTRIGVSSKHKKELYQSCHILHKKGKFYIVHFKELFQLDGKTTNIDETDVKRRNTIVRLLADWGLLSVVDPEKIQEQLSMNQIKIISYLDKYNWVLTAKYNIGKYKSQSEH